MLSSCFRRAFTSVNSVSPQPARIGQLGIQTRRSQLEVGADLGVEQRGIAHDVLPVFSPQPGIVVLERHAVMDGRWEDDERPAAARDWSMRAMDRAHGDLLVNLGDFEAGRPSLGKRRALSNHGARCGGPHPLVTIVPQRMSRALQR